MSKRAHEHATLSLSPAKAATSKVAFTWYRQQSSCSVLLVAQIGTRIMHVLFLSSLIFLTRGHALVEASTQRWAFKNQGEQYKQNKVPSDYVLGLF